MSAEEIRKLMILLENAEPTDDSETGVIDMMNPADTSGDGLVNRQQILIEPEEPETIERPQQGIEESTDLLSFEDWKRSKYL